MKTEWVTKSLGELCTIERGGSPRPIESFLTKAPDGINWIKIGDTKNVTKYISQTEEKIKPEGAKRSRMVYEGDFILSNSMSFGRPYIMKTSGCIHDGWLVLREREPNVLQDYLYYLLSSDLIFRQFDKLAAGSTVRNLNIGLVQRVEVPIAPAGEQRRIVGILDNAFACIATAKGNAEKNLQNARALFESHLEAVFVNRAGWMEMPLNDLGTTQTGSTPSNSQTGSYGKFIPFIKPSDFNTDGSLNYQNDGLSEAGMASARIVKAGSILMVCIGATIGKCGFSDRDVTTNQQVNSLTPSKHTSHKFLYYQLRTRAFQQHVLDRASQATLPIINKSKWSSLKVVLPSEVAEQQRIAHDLDMLLSESQHLERIYQRKLAALDEFKKSLLHQAFTGQL
jgi:type I restriction enzyme, S subunit